MSEIVEFRRKLSDGKFEELLVNDSERIYSLEEVEGDYNSNADFELLLNFAMMIGYTKVSRKDVLNSNTEEELVKPSKELLDKIFQLYNSVGLSSAMMQKDMKLGLHSVYSIIKWLLSNNIVEKIENSNRYKFIMNKQEFENYING